MKILRVSTVALFVDMHLHSQLKMMIDAGFNVSIATSDSALNKPIEGINYYCIEIPREISLLKDLVALFKLIILIKREKFKIVHSTTPKAGLLCAIAGKLACVPIRIHTYTGQRWATLTGLKKSLVMLSDKIIGSLTTICYADSHSQRKYLIEKKILRPTKLNVVGKGSISGVDLNRFNSERFSELGRKSLKENLSIPTDATVFLFVGRINKDKGVVELVVAFGMALKINPNLYLILVGPDELNENDSSALSSSMSMKNILFVGYSEAPEQFMSISDVLCLPSYREGFGTVVIEAAAMGLPTIGTNISGLSDAIVDGVTGLLVNVKDPHQLSSAITRLANDKEQIIKLGENARKRAKEFYSDDYVNKLVIDEYMSLLNKT